MLVAIEFKNIVTSSTLKSKAEKLKDRCFQCILECQKNNQKVMDFDLVPDDIKDDLMKHIFSIESFAT